MKPLLTTFSLFFFGSCAFQTNIPLFYHTVAHTKNISSADATVLVVGGRARPIRLSGTKDAADIRFQPFHNNGAAPMLLEIELVRNGVLEWMVHVPINIPGTQSNSIALTITDDGVLVSGTGNYSNYSNNSFFPGIRRTGQKCQPPYGPTIYPSSLPTYHPDPCPPPNPWAPPPPPPFTSRRAQEGPAAFIFAAAKIP